MRIRPLGTEMFHEDGGTDRQTDMTKLIVARRNFATTPKKKCVHCIERCNRSQRNMPRTKRSEVNSARRTCSQSPNVCS